MQKVHFQLQLFLNIWKKYYLSKKLALYSKRSLTSWKTIIFSSSTFTVNSEISNVQLFVFKLMRSNRFLFYLGKLSFELNKIPLSIEKASALFLLRHVLINPSQGLQPWTWVANKSLCWSWKRLLWNLKSWSFRNLQVE